MDRLSHSQLNGWTGCGERYRLERIVGVPQRPGWALIGGNAVHDTTENHDLREHGVDVPPLTFEEAFEARTVEAEERDGFDRSEFRASGRKSNQWPDKENADWWLANGPGMVQRWVTWTRNVPWVLWVTPEGQPAVEVEFNYVSLEEGFTIKGFIDRVYHDPATGRLIVVDIKTGAQKQSSGRQLGTYRIGLEDKYAAQGVAVPLGTFWDARGGATDRLYDLGWFTKERLDWSFRQLKRARASGMYLPNPSALCSSCSVRDYCYEVEGEKAGEVPPPWAAIGEVRTELEMETADE